MEEKREIQKRSRIWRSQKLWLIIAVVLGFLGGVALSQTPGCQVGVYDCVGQLFLYNGKVGIGIANPDTTLHVAGTGAKLHMGPQDTINEGGEIQLDGAGSNTEWNIDNYQSKFRLHHGGTEYMSVDAAGNMAIAGRMTTGAVPLARLSSNSPCAAGYSEVNGWCIDTDGQLAVIRFATANETSYTTTTIMSGAKLALIKVLTRVDQDGTAENGNAIACTRPGDSTISTCATNDETTASARALLANESSIDQNTILVRLGASGQVKTRCTVTGTLIISACYWHLVAYQN